MKDLKKAPDSPDVEYFPFCKQDAVIEYLKHVFANKPIEIRTPRIEIEARELEESVKRELDCVAR